VRPVTSGAVSDLPVHGRWDFGGFAYGLEPLVLPPAGSSEAVDDDSTGLASAGAYAETCRRIHTLGERGVLTPEVERCDAPEELFWFRWITGHQVCFVVWRLIAELLDDVNHGRRSPYEALEPMCRYLDGYSAMLLYTGSCPRDIYSVLIRPSMRLRHRAFSGTWAPDYWPIRDLLRGRQPSVMWNADTGDLLDAITLQHAVHAGVAAKLVTDGRSLLREASVRGPNHRMAGMIYDTYFTTLRARVLRHDVVAQLLRRLVAIVQDIAANGMYPNDHSDELPVELQTAEVVKCENSLVDIVLEVARCACELAPAELSGPRPSALRNTAAEV
jgi:L-tyrosine peroxygenase